MKRGFTLIEIMAVIVVLGIIGLIAVVAVDKTIKDNNEKLYQMQISNIEDAARIWGTNNLKYLPDDLDEAISIPLVALKKDGLVDKEITNPKTKELFYNDMYIDITYVNGIYSYDVVEDSGSDTTNNLDAPVIIIYDTLNKELIKGSTLESNGVVILRSGEELELNSTSPYITINTNLNSNITGTYNYSIKVSDGNGFTTTRKITVK